MRRPYTSTASFKSEENARRQVSNWNLSSFVDNSYEVYEVPSRDGSETLYVEFVVQRMAPVNMEHAHFYQSSRTWKWWWELVYMAEEFQQCKIVPEQEGLDPKRFGFKFITKGMPGYPDWQNIITLRNLPRTLDELYDEIDDIFSEIIELTVEDGEAKVTGFYDSIGDASYETGIEPWNISEAVNSDEMKMFNDKLFVKWNTETKLLATDLEAFLAASERKATAAQARSFFAALAIREDPETAAEFGIF